MAVLSKGESHVILRTSTRLSNRKKEKREAKKEGSTGCKGTGEGGAVRTYLWERGEATTDWQEEKGTQGPTAGLC